MEGGSSPPDLESVVSRKSSIPSSGRTRNRKEFLQRFVDSEFLSANLEDWLSLTDKSTGRKCVYGEPFELVELQKFDFALEGVSFRQLMRMPSPLCASSSDSVEATAFLAVEDFLHASARGLWEAFWSQNEPMPFSAASLYNENSKFYPAEKAIAKGKLGGLCATALMMNNPRHPHGKWDHILEIALLRPGLSSYQVDSDRELPPLILGESLFFAIRVLIARSLSRLSFPQGSNCVYVLLLDSQYGGVMKVEGDINKMDFDINNIYGSASEWIKNHAQVSVSSIDRIWNKLGNANWGDIGALQVLFGTFQSIVQFAGMPMLSIEDLAADHSIRLRARRMERRLDSDDSQPNGDGLFRSQNRAVSPEIVEVPDESIRIETEEELKLEVGSVLWLEESNWQKGYKINMVLNDGDLLYYDASPVDDPGMSFFLYVGSPPSQLEPAWVNMNLWYQVQRQTKVLNSMKQKGVSSKYLSQLVSSGRIIHPGQCQRPSSGGNCNHPWCGTPILVTSPVGETIADMICSGRFGVDEAIKCCHDCLSALSAAASVGIRHGDIRPENIICVSSGVRLAYYVLAGWGHAVLEERDRPAMNLHFSSTYALQEGKLCSASDAESLVYLLYFSTGGHSPNLDSVEGALEWRENAWSRRQIQQKLGEVSTVLKAFADYVDSLCGTPYPIDYEIWLKRLKKNMHKDEHGKEIESSS
ncbi:unnamed protein product [Rhodiola kirilowii]